MYSIKLRLCKALVFLQSQIHALMWQTRVCKSCFVCCSTVQEIAKSAKLEQAVNGDSRDEGVVMLVTLSILTK